MNQISVAKRAASYSAMAMAVALVLLIVVAWLASARDFPVIDAARGTFLGEGLSPWPAGVRAIWIAVTTFVFTVDQQGQKEHSNVRDQALVIASRRLHGTRLNLFDLRTAAPPEREGRCSCDVATQARAEEANP